MTTIHKPTDKDYILNRYVAPILVIGLGFACVLDSMGVFG